QPDRDRGVRAGRLQQFGIVLAAVHRAGRDDADRVPADADGGADPGVLRVHAGTELRNSGEATGRRRALASYQRQRRGGTVITNVSLVTVYVNDIDEAKAFYTEKLGFVLGDDITLSEDFRWCTVHQADHPELELALMLPGAPMDEESAGWIKRIMAKGS